MTYDDAILAPGSWPGTRLAYALHADALVLSLSYDPSAATGEAAAFAYRTAAAQLADPNLAIAVTATFSHGVVDDGALLRPVLEAYLASREAALVALPVTLAEPNGHAFPVVVALTLSRPGDLVHRTGAAASVPGSDTVTEAVPPDLDDRDCFAGLHGWHVAVDTSSAWALRWTATAEADTAIFAIPPLSREPVSGTAQAVTSYDDAWQPTTKPATYAKVDLGEWAATYLAALDRLVAPRFAPLRAELATTLAASLAPLSGTGDVAAARGAVEGVATGSLAAAYAVAAVAQVRAAVTGPAGTRLTGPGAASLPLSGDPAYLTFAVTPAEPVATLPLDVRFTPDAVVRDTALGPRRLRLLSTESLDAGHLDVPVPARALPGAPSLGGQSATQVPGDTFAWDHAVTVTLPNGVPQDELTLLVTYEDPPLLAATAASDPLFEALASFVSAWPLLSPALDAPTDALLDAVEAQGRPVADAWAAVTAPPAALPPPPGDLYVVSFRDAPSGVVHVRARDDRWPTIDGVSPAPATRQDDGWHAADYAIPDLDPDTALTFGWRLDARTRTSATASCRVTRNATLPAPFATSTPWVAFAQPVVPLFVIPSGPTVPAGATLVATLTDALADVTAWAAPEGRTLRVEISYSYALAGEERATIPVLMTPAQALPEGFVAGLATQAGTWLKTQAPTLAGGLLETAATVYAEVDGETVPLARFEPIAVTVPDGGW